MIERRSQLLQRTARTAFDGHNRACVAKRLVTFISAVHPNLTFIDLCETLSDSR